MNSYHLEFRRIPPLRLLRAQGRWKQSTPELSIVLPCLNEEETLQRCLEELHQVMDNWNGPTWECLVADNGSRDRSLEIAALQGARCLRITPEGYGNALQGGIRAARGRWIVYFDSDGTYCLEDLPRLYDATVSAGAAMGIASRFGRRLPAGAMPVLHHRLGTPILSWLIRVCFGGSVRDCNSGFRCVDRARFLEWKVSASGMEFASEVLVGALCSGCPVIEISSSLRVTLESRVPRLSTWRDGMRHLLVILSHAPKVFERIGIALIVFSLSMQLTASITGPVKMGPAEFLGIHSQLLLLGAGMLGLQSYTTGCYIIISGARMSESMKLTRFLVGLQPATLLIALVGCCVMSVLMTAAFVVFWARRGFHGINEAGWLLFFFELVFLPGFLALLLLAVHVTKTSLIRQGMEVVEIRKCKIPVG